MVFPTPQLSFLAVTALDIDMERSPIDVCLNESLYLMDRFSEIVFGWRLVMIER
jgi:hypothetical protein